MTKKSSILFKLLLLTILLVFIVLRFWKVKDLFYYGIDEEYQGYLAESIVKDFHIIWIGLSAANTGFYVGPGFTYLNALLFFILKGDPIILGYFASLVGIITLIIFYYVGESLFNKKIALISTIMYGFSTWTIIYDRRFWNSTFVPIVVVLLIYSFKKSIENNSWLMLTAFLYAISLHIHFSLIIFFPLILLQLYLIYKKQKKINIGIVFLSLIIFLLIISPLIVYDFVHNFDNLKTPLRILSSIKEYHSPGVYFSKLWTISYNISRFILFRPFKIVSQVLTLIFIITTIFYCLKPKKFSKLIIIYFSLTYLLASLLYPGIFIDYYLISFMPIFAIVIADTIKNLKSQLLYCLLILFVIININNFKNEIKSLENRGVGLRIKIINKTCRYLKNKNYSLVTNGVYMDYGGWSYLFKHYCKPPFQSQADEVFGWIYPREINTKIPDYQILLSSRLIDNQRAEKVIREKGINVYIIKIDK